MLQLHDKYIGLNSLLISFQMKAFLLSHILEVCAERDGQFKVSQSFVKIWAKEHLRWNFQKPTSNTSKLPANWKSKGELLLFQIACYWFWHSIQFSSECRSDCNPLAPSWQWKNLCARGARDVKFVGRGDKRQVTSLLSCTVADNVLPLQVIFDGKTTWCLPKGQQAHRLGQAYMGGI